MLSKATIDAYNELMFSMRLYIHGPAIDIVDPLGREVYFGDRFTDEHKLSPKYLDFRRDYRRGRTVAEARNIKARFDAFKAQLRKDFGLIGIPRLEYEEEGLRMHELLHAGTMEDMFDNRVQQDKPVGASRVALSMWPGIHGVTKTQVVSEYTGDFFMLSFHQFLMSAKLPRSLKAFIVSYQGLNNLPRLARNSIRQEHAFDVRRCEPVFSLSTFLYGSIMPRKDLHLLCLKILDAWRISLNPDHPDHRAILFQGVAKLDRFQKRDLANYKKVCRFTNNDPDYIATIGDLDMCNERYAGQSIADVYVLVELVTMLYTCCGPDMSIRYADYCDTGYDTNLFMGMDKTEKKMFPVLEIPDVIPAENVVEATLVIRGNNREEMMDYIDENGHVYVFRVDMTECHRLPTLLDVEYVVDRLRENCPFVRHVICRLGMYINQIPQSLLKWPSATIIDLTSSPGIICGPAEWSSCSIIKEVVYPAAVPHRVGPPPIFIDFDGRRQTIYARHVRVISRLSRHSKITAKHILSLYPRVDLLTMDDGRIIQAITDFHDYRCLVTIFENPGEIFNLVPSCNRRKNGACFECMQAYARMDDGASRPSEVTLQCFAACKRSETTKGNPFQSDGKYNHIHQEVGPSSDRTAVHEPQPRDGVLSTACRDCEKILGPLVKSHFPMCVSTCPRRKVPRYSECGECEECTLFKCESNVFWVEANIAKVNWPEFIARELMLLYSLRGKDICVVVALSADASVTMRTYNDAKDFIALLAPAKTQFIDTDDLLAGRAFGHINALAPMGGVQIRPSQIKELNPLVVHRGPNSFLRARDAVREGVYEMWAEDFTMLRLVDLVFGNRTKRGMGIHHLEEVLTWEPDIFKYSDVKGALRVLDRMGVVRLIGEYVFLSLRHYSVFVDLVLADPIIIPEGGAGGEGAGGGGVLRYLEMDKHYRDEDQAWHVRACSLLEYMRAHVNQHGPNPALSIWDVLRTLSVTRVAKLRKDLDDP
jgi:hypothetical protein